jgi:hypothetical protein
MNTQKFTGRGNLINRLAAQVGDRSLAVKILQKRGHLEADGKTLTAEGMKRNMMTAKERAIDRASKEYNRPTEDFNYNPFKNRAYIKK